MEMTDKSPTVSNHETKPNHDGDALSPHDRAPGSGEFKNVRAISPPRTLVNLPTIVPPKRDLIVELGQRCNLDFWGYMSYHSQGSIDPIHSDWVFSYLTMEWKV